MYSYYLARSIKGHDAGEIYMVIGQNNGRLLCVNGENKPIEKPKLKNPTHVQPIVKGQWKSTIYSKPDNCTVKRCIRLYLKSEDPKEEA